MNSPEWLRHWEAERAHARGLGERAAELPEDVRPAAIVFTGNGLQLFYRLAQPIDASDRTAVATIEQAWRDEVSRAVGSDAVQSIEHLFAAHALRSACPLLQRFAATELRAAPPSGTHGSTPVTNTILTYRAGHSAEPLANQSLVAQVRRGVYRVSSVRPELLTMRQGVE